MCSTYNLRKLKQEILNNDFEAFRELFIASKELYHAHEDEHEEVGLFLLQHMPQLIRVIVKELTEWFSIDDDFNCYDYLFSSFSDESIQALEEGIFFRVNEMDIKVLNYGILPHLFERGIYNHKG